MEKIGDIAVPFIICSIILFGLYRGVDVFEAFKEGVKEGALSLWAAAPSLAGLVIGVSILSASGFFDIISQVLTPVFSLAGIPSEVLPLALIRPVSGSGANAVLSSILGEYGADSLIGRTASVMAGSTETTFYTIAVYYGAVGIRRTRYTAAAALTADICGMISACIFTRLLF